MRLFAFKKRIIESFSKISRTKSNKEDFKKYIQVCHALRYASSDDSKSLKRLTKALHTSGNSSSFNFDLQIRYLVQYNPHAIQILELIHTNSSLLEPYFTDGERFARRFGLRKRQTQLCTVDIISWCNVRMKTRKSMQLFIQTLTADFLGFECKEDITLVDSKQEILSSLQELACKHSLEDPYPNEISPEMEGVNAARIFLRDDNISDFMRYFHTNAKRQQAVIAKSSNFLLIHYRGGGCSSEAQQEGLAHPYFTQDDISWELGVLSTLLSLHLPYFVRKRILFYLDMTLRIPLAYNYNLL